MDRAADLLSQNGVTVREVANRVGYRQAAQFAKAFRAAPRHVAVRVPPPLGAAAPRPRPARARRAAHLAGLEAGRAQQRVQLGDRALAPAVALGEHLDVDQRRHGSGSLGSWRFSTSTTRAPAASPRGPCAGSQAALVVPVVQHVLERVDVGARVDALEDVARAELDAVAHAGAARGRPRPRASTPGASTSTPRSRGFARRIPASIVPTPPATSQTVPRAGHG